MKAQLKTIVFSAAVILATLAGQHVASAQQQQQQPTLKTDPQTTNGRTTAAPETGRQRERRTSQTEAATEGSTEPAAASPVVEKQDGATVSSSGGGVLDETSAGRPEEKSEEEAAVLLHYNNFMTSYRLGPEDIISITVFGHERYSKGGIVIPPTGIIAYPLISEGIRVRGRTAEQVQAELTKRLDEYIIDPKVSVSLDQARSARYSVLGDVVQPGIKAMTRRLSVYEAITESGGVLRTGDKKKVILLRRQPDGMLQPKVINIALIEKGKAADMDYLAPGDQVVVPGNRFKTVNAILNYLPILSFARIFTGGGF